MTRLKLPWYLAGLVLLFLITRFTNLTSLPVFADEAIYLKWSQAALREPDKYLLLPMLDGKPPLHNFVLMPFVASLKDPLFGGRMVSVIAGLITLVVFDRLVVALGGKQKARIVASLTIILAPMWHFYHRIALAESLLALWYTLMLYFGLKCIQEKKVIYVLALGLVTGAALWTKTNALFLIPTLLVLPWMVSSYRLKSISDLQKIVSNHLIWRLAAGCALGLFLFLLLKLTPLFPFLFSRSLDYSFTLSEVLMGEWRYVATHNIPQFLLWFLFYFSPFLLFLIVSKSKKIYLLLFSIIIYSAPLLLVGRVLTPRYFFPLVVPLTLSLALSSELTSNKKWKLIQNICFICMFIYFGCMTLIATCNPSRTPLISVDQNQYLADWSSGYGIPEIRDYLSIRAKNKAVYVATEGYFGTLPDGLQIYFEGNKKLDNLEIEGIGQPVNYLPEKLLLKAKEGEAYLVVNSHRMNLISDQLELIASYKRPVGDITLDFYRVKK